MHQEYENELLAVRRYWERAQEVQAKRNDIYVRLYQRYKGFNPNILDIYRSNLVMPKLYTMVETVTPRINKALYGRRPYIPIRNNQNPVPLKYIESVLDTYLYRDKFKIKAGQTTKAVALFGTSFLEPIPAQETVRVIEAVQSEEYPWHMVKQEVEKKRFKIDVRQLMPWQVYVEPNMLNLDSPGYAIIVEFTAKSEIQRMIAEGRYLDVDLSIGGDTEDMKFAETMMESIGITLPTEDNSYGVLMRFQSRDEYITLWNGLQVLEARSNPYKHKKINLVRCAWNQDPMLQNSFWGQPEGKVCEPIMDKLDECLNQIADSNDIINQGIVSYHEDAVDNPNLMVAIGGARWPIRGDFQGTRDEAIGAVDMGRLPPEAFTLPAMYDREIDRTFGSYGEQRGEKSPGEKTATESSILANNGDLRNEDRTAILEAMGLGAFADRCTSHIDEFSDVEDWAEIIGDAAVEVLTMDPNLVAGGFNYEFKGSDTIIKDALAMSEWRSDLDIIKDNPYLKQDGILEKTFELRGLNEEEVGRLVHTDEDMAQMQEGAIEAEDEVRRKDLEADIILAEVTAASKERHETKKEPAKKSPDKKKQKPTERRNVGNARKKT